MKVEIIRAITKAVPSVIPLLRGDALCVAVTGDASGVDFTKTVGTYFFTLRGLVLGVYTGEISEGDFKARAISLMTQQLNEAKNQAYENAGVEPYGPAETFVENVIQSETHYLVNFYADIVDARQTQAGTDRLLQRCQLFANRYLDVYSGVLQIIYAAFGEKMVWILGDADHCSTCEALNGIVAYAKEWADLEVYTQRPPNSKLECGGWNCKCTLIPTTARKTRGAVGRILNAVL